MGRVAARSATIKNPTGYVIKAARQEERETAEQIRRTAEGEEEPWQGEAAFQTEGTKGRQWQTAETNEPDDGWEGEDPWQEEVADQTDGAEEGQWRTTEAEVRDGGWGAEASPDEAGWGYGYDEEDKETKEDPEVN